MGLGPAENERTMRGLRALVGITDENTVGADRAFLLLDEIDRLRAENERLTAHLKAAHDRIGDHCVPCGCLPSGDSSPKEGA